MGTSPSQGKGVSEVGVSSYIGIESDMVIPKACPGFQNNAIRVSVRKMVHVE